jgi:Nuclease-related domain
MRAAQWAAWTRTLPLRIAFILGMGAGGGVLGSLLAPQLGLFVGGLAAVATTWGLRFRPSPDAVVWRRGAAGERRTARLLTVLERHGWSVLHDLAVPRSQANIDHLVIGPGGVFVIDSKQYRGRLQLDPSGRLWHGRYPFAPDPAGSVVRGRPGCPGPARPGHGGAADRGHPWCAGPLGKVIVGGVPVVSARRLPSMLRQLPAVLGPERVADLADQVRVRFHPAV